MADHPVDRRIDAILGKYDLRDREQYKNAVVELTKYLLTLNKRDTVKSLYYESIQDKIYLERCLRIAPNDPKPL